MNKDSIQPKEVDITTQVYLDQTRHLRFTSSKVHNLTSTNRGGTGPGQPFFTLCEEVYFRHLLDRDLEVEAYSRPMAWGEYVERYVFELLGWEYSLESKVQFTHPEKDLAQWWSGRPDVLRHQPVKAVGDVKCPQPKNYAFMVDLFLKPWTTGEKLEFMKKDKDLKKYYWQLVSNAILTDCEFAQLIVFLPTEMQLEEIRHQANSIDEESLPAGRTIWDYKFIADNPKHKLPHIANSSLLKPLYSFEFEVPEEDKILLTERVQLARDTVKGYLEKFMSE